MNRFLALLKFAKPYWGLAFLNVLFNLLYVLFNLFSLTLLVPFLDLLFSKDNAEYAKRLAAGEPEITGSLTSVIDFFNYTFTRIIVENGKPQALMFICIAVLVLIFFKNTFRYLAMFYLAPVRNYIVRDLRNKIYHKILELPLAYYSEEKKGDIMSRMTNDVQEIEWSVMQSLEAIFREPINIIGFLIALLVMSAKLTIFVFILLPVMGLLIGQIGKKLRRTSTQSKEMLGEILSVLEESLSGLRVIKAFNASDFMHRKFVSLNQSYTKLMVRVYRRTDLSGPVSETLGVLVLVGVMLYGGGLVLSGEGDLKAAVFLTYIAVFSQIIPPAKAFTTALYNAQKGMASAERIYKILDAENTIQETPHAIEIKEFKHAIEYKNVSFAYRAGEVGYVLKNIELKIEKGKTIALVGQSGSGKTTMADMVPRFYDISEGELLIDGVDIKNYRINDLRSLMGIVSQEAILFNDSVANNIAFGLKDIKREDIEMAAKIANAHEFISQMPMGYDTNIGDRGSKLSGGQRQRLSIARAVLKNPAILILDEATSALDTESERLVQDALNKLMANRTSVVIAHRLSTIQHADEIVVLNKGEIVERGKHQELLSRNGYYKRLCDLQSFV